MYLQSTAEPTQEQDKARVQAACLLASLAVRALIEEADLTPKPALVDERGSGAHDDLSLKLMKRSARCLGISFELMARASYQQIPGTSLREQLGAIGRSGEHMMLLNTGGVNTHRGGDLDVGSAGLRRCDGIDFAPGNRRLG